MGQPQWISHRQISTIQVTRWTTYVEKNGTIYAIGTGSNTCRVCAFVESLSIVAGLAGVILLLRGVSRLVNGEADATEG